MPESMDWTLETETFYARQKELVRARLMKQMGWPKESWCMGPSTYYLLFEIPKVYQEEKMGIDRFRDDLLLRAAAFRIDLRFHYADDDMQFAVSQKFFP